ncbi:hypothetical protein CFP56_016628, partial [Quercus suber]
MEKAVSKKQEKSTEPFFYLLCLVSAFFTPMETTSSSTPQKEKSRLPPKRGQIKARIFESFVKKVASTASKL